MKTLLLTMTALLGVIFACTDTGPHLLEDGRQARSASSFSYTNLDVRPTTFILDNRRDTFLWGDQGVLLYLPAKTFITEEGNHQVELYLKEYTNPSQSLAQNIATTTSDQHLLTSTTIFHLKAQQGNTPVQLAPRKEFRLHVLHTPKTKKETVSLWAGHPQSWEAINFDRPTLFNHYLKIGGYKEKKFANGQSIDAWEKKRFRMTPKEEATLWAEEPYLHLQYTINKRGTIENVAFKEPITNDFQRRILQEMASYPRCRPHLVNGQPEAVQCVYAFHVHQAEPKYREDTDYLAAIKRNKQVLLTRNLDHIDDLELQYHIFNAQQLGWMAVGKAYPVQKSVDLTVEVDPNVLVDVKVLLHDSKAIVMGKRQGNEVLFRGLPQDKDIHIIAMGSRANQPVYAEAFANTSDGTISDLLFEAISYEDLRATIRHINTPRQ